MKTHFIVLLFSLLFGLSGLTQEISIDKNIGKRFNDRHKYSNTLAMQKDQNGNTVVVRGYFSGLVLRPKGYLIEVFDAKMNLINDYNYKLKDVSFVKAVVANGTIALIFLDYDYGDAAYTYKVHKSNLEAFDFQEETLLSFESKPVEQPYDRNFYNRNFTTGFTTTLLSDANNIGFVISTHCKKGKENKHYIHAYDNALRPLMQDDFSNYVETKNYSFENLAISADKQNVYLMGKAYFKKKRFQVNQRKFQYELVHLNKTGSQVQTFNEEGKYPESLVPIVDGAKLYCVGFYSDNKYKGYNGLVFYALDSKNLLVNSKKYNAFSQSFMQDKFGRKVDKEIKNLVFKNAGLDDEGNLLFNAEEYFITKSTQENQSGSRVNVERFHHNDIVCAKLSPQGDMIWARNINKTEVTQGDGAYVSYSTYVKDGSTYLFLASAAEEPQVLPGDRIFFKQGYSDTRNLFVIRISTNGTLSYEKILNGKELRLPIMISIPLIDLSKDALTFYAKRGSKKQLLALTVN